MPYWIADSLAGTPAFLWIYVGLGCLWSLAILPRADWRRPAQVIALGFALGPALLTAWMFILGTLGAPSQSRLLTTTNVWLGTVALALVALAVMWRRRRAGVPPGEPTARLSIDERLLIGLIAASLVVCWFVIAYWPFTAYDSLWVYGYEGRLYALLGYIPQTVGYYPQFMPLQYTFAQLGGINDHAARAGLIFIQIGSILAAYALGSRLVNRRTGIVAAAIWALYPHVGEWSRAGDLEIALAFLFTLAAAFYLLAWRDLKRDYALIGGLVLGIGLWTKPTMGAFVLGMALLLVIERLRPDFDPSRWRGRLRVALWAGIAALPLGAVWYVRNLLLGLPPLVFPPSFWQSMALRSGGEWGWLLAALITWVIYLRVRFPRAGWRFGVIGLALVLLALVPSILSPRRLTIIEFGLLGAGLALLALTLRRMIRESWDGELKATAATVGWGLALALPYFLTWFYSYSYHYRLSFAVVPLLILPTAVVVARLFTPERAGRGVLRFAYLAVIVLIGLPGVISAVNDPNGGGDYLWTGKYPDDTARYRSGNVALMNVVDGLQIWLDQHPGEKLVVSAPGVDTLPFFFPLQDIRVDDPPTRLDVLDDAAYLVVGNPETRIAYRDVPELDNQVLSALNRTDIMRRAWGMDDGTFRYDVYELDLAKRWVEPQPQGAAGRDVTFGGFVRYLGYDIGGLDLWQGRKVIAHFYWQVLSPPPDDFTIYIHLRAADDSLITGWDGPIARGVDDRYYTSLLWQPGEYIVDERVLSLPDDLMTGANPPPFGAGYRIVIGMYNSRTQERVPVTVDGVAAGDGYEVENRMSIVEIPPS
ncbi:MAG: glycosyltransferase family 39 protein [Anaerolineae bacterium]